MSNFTPIINNKNILYKYDIKYELDAGLILKGWEVKLIRFNKININNSYIKIINNEVFLLGINFTKKIFNTNNNLNKNRNIKLLLRSKEIEYLNIEIKSNKKYTIVPIKLFWNKNSIAKIKIGLVINKKNLDIRKKIRDKQIKLETLKILNYKNFKN